MQIFVKTVEHLDFITSDENAELQYFKNALMTIDAALRHILNLHEFKLDNSVCIQRNKIPVTTSEWGVEIVFNFGNKFTSQHLSDFINYIRHSISTGADRNVSFFEHNPISILENKEISFGNLVSTIIQHNNNTTEIVFKVTLPFDASHPDTKQKAFVLLGLEELIRYDIKILVGKHVEN